MNDSAIALAQENRRQGAAPDGWTAAPRYRREADRLWTDHARALEALDRAEEAEEGAG